MAISQNLQQVIRNLIENMQLSQELINALNVAASPIDLATDVTGNLSVTHLNGGLNASPTTFWSGNGTWATPPAGSSYIFADSLVNNSGTVTLVNDSAAPGDSMYYGTDGSGTFGYFALPVSPVTSVNGSTGAVVVSYTSLNVQLAGATSVGIGSGALISNAGASNSALGYEALFSNTSGASNVAVGSLALYTNGVGNNNVAVGHQALYTNAGGGANVALGSQASYNNTSGNNNFSVGGQALYSNSTGSYNIAIGGGALYDLTTASQNTAVGANGLAGVTTGTNNVSLGYFAGQTGNVNESVFIGAGSNGANGLTNSIAIGYNAIVSASNYIQIGNSSHTQFNIYGHLTWGTDGTYDIGSPNAGVTNERPRNLYLAGLINAQGVITSHNQFQGPNGIDAQPSYSFINVPTSGMYMFNQGAGSLGFSVLGAPIAQINASGMVLDGFLELEGSTSGAVTISASATTATYALVLPAAQGAAGTVPQNDGSGNLSWVPSGPSVQGPVTINDNQVVAATLVTYAASIPSTIFEYSIVRGSAVETGRIMVATDGTTVGFESDSAQNDTPSGVTFNVVLSGSNVLVQYTSTSTGTAGTFSYIQINLT